MKHAPIIILSLSIIITAASGCDKSAVTHQKADVGMVYEFFADYTGMSSEERLQAYCADSDAIDAFMLTLGIENPDSDDFAAWARSGAVEVFTPDVESVFGSGEGIAEDIGMVLDNSTGTFEFPVREYAAVVYGRPESILFVDSVMLIALNHYLGADYPGYSHIPAYQRQAKTPEMLPYDIAEALVATSNPFDGDNSSTLLSRMLYEGALAAIKTHLVDGSTAAEALGYDDETYKWLLDNEKKLWDGLIEQKMLYDTSPTLIRKLTEPAPAAQIGGISAPGRVGRFIGYRIIDAYLRNKPDTPLDQLLNADFYHSTEALESYIRSH